MTADPFWLSMKSAAFHDLPYSWRGPTVRSRPLTLSTLPLSDYRQQLHTHLTVVVALATVVSVVRPVLRLARFASMVSTKTALQRLQNSTKQKMAVMVITR